MYRQGKWKYVFNCGGDDELYDLENDPDEMENLVRNPALQETLKELQVGLAKAMYHHDDSCTPWYCKVNHLLDWELKGE